MKIEKCIGIPTFFQWYGSASKHYPDFLAEAIVINGMLKICMLVVVLLHYFFVYTQAFITSAPAPVPVALSILRPVLSADVRDRITVFDSNKNVWMTYLDSRIDKSQRSERYIVITRLQIFNCSLFIFYIKLTHTFAL